MHALDRSVYGRTWKSLRRRGPCEAMQMELIASYQTVVLNVHAEVENAGMPAQSEN
jgi:hypothetical protein